MVLMNSGQWLEAGRPGKAKGVRVMTVEMREEGAMEIWWDMELKRPDGGSEGKGGIWVTGGRRCYLLR